MGKISTKELLERFSDSVEGSAMKLTVRSFDKPELYAYEKKIGKELVDMNDEELIGLILDLKNKRKGQEVEFVISHASYEQTSTLLRAVFNFYINNIEVIKNPFNNKNMRGRQIMKKLTERKELFSWKTVEDIIKKLHEDKDVDNADYVELLLLMYYNGFSKAEEIATLKPEMIDHSAHTVRLPENTVPLYLSPRCYELLTKFYEKEKISGWRGDFALATWRGGYFKFIIRPDLKKTFDDRSLALVCNILNRRIAVDVNNAYNTKINYRLLYWLGFYDFLQKKYGEKRTQEMLNSFRNLKDAEDLMNAVKEYGCKLTSLSHIKMYLSPFIKLN